ncbi:hypothetical protein ACSNOI_40320 [Actinomadura kijaniata]|uniref:hypothetical protein n=1 Tax=Actinomadura kijaniata TaxID=46161 RepID=UPI003F1A6733
MHRTLSRAVTVLATCAVTLLPLAGAAQATPAPAPLVQADPDDEASSGDFTDDKPSVAEDVERVGG